MNLMEMFIVVLAVVLFASTAIVQHQTMVTAADTVTNASHTVQAMQIGQEILDEEAVKKALPYIFKTVLQNFYFRLCSQVLTTSTLVLA